MLSIPIWKFSPKWEPGKSHFLSNLLQSLIIKHWTLLYFQKKTLEIIMKQLGPEVTINPNFGEIRKQSLDNYFETCLTKHCDVTTLYLKEWKIKYEEEPSVWRKVSHLSVNVNMNQTLLANTDPNDTSATMQNAPFIQTRCTCQASFGQHTALCPVTG